MLQIQVIEQEVNQLNYQLELIDHNLSELNELKSSLNEIEKKETKSILTNLGKKIYLPVDITDKKLLVNVGNKHFVKKTIPETNKIVDEQVKKLSAGKTEILYRLEALNQEIENLMHNTEKE